MLQVLQGWLLLLLLLLKGSPCGQDAAQKKRELAAQEAAKAEKAKKGEEDVPEQKIVVEQTDFEKVEAAAAHVARC